MWWGVDISKERIRVVPAPREEDRLEVSEARLLE